MKMNSPMHGRVVPLSEVDDPVFAEGIAGDGVAIIPEPPEGNIIEVSAPAAGHLARLFEGGHAFAIATKDGVELIVHIGIDTIEMKGSGFEKLAAEGDTVEAGQMIVRADISRIRGGGYDPVTPVIVMNSDSHPVLEKTTGTVKPGDFLYEVS